MIGTYAAVVAVCGASLVVGQAAIGLCGGRRWSWLSPAIGLALLLAVCWATVRLPGRGSVSALVVLALTISALVCLHGRVEGGGEALRVGVPVAAPALLAASLPFLVEGHFGILGTGFNPDMSQHLLATDRLAHGAGSQLLHQGYPLGPHAVVVALNEGLGIGLVQGFSGLTIAAAILAPLTALAAFVGQPPLRRTAAALLVGLPFLVASYFAQGAFKETIQALFVLAFALALRESTRTWRDLPLRFVPAAIIAIGSIYTYSFPSLIWLAGTALIWAAVELGVRRLDSSAGGVGVGWTPLPGGCGGERPNPGEAMSHPPEQRAGQGGDPTPTRGPAAEGFVPWRPLLLAFVVFLVGALPELGRMIDFHNFETFDPNGPGLGNLFGQISPFEALGIWPSGDFRLAPGDGAAPAFAYCLGAVFATCLLVLGIRRAWRGGERAILAGLVSVACLYVAARLGGTPYTSAKALEIAAPLITLTILLPVNRVVDPSASSATGPGAAALILYLFAAGACSLLAFANAPVGPTSYSPALTGLRPLIVRDSTLFLAPETLLADEHGAPYIIWELRGGRVCVEPGSAAGGAPPSGVRFVITTDASDGPPFRSFELNRRAGPYLLWERPGPLGGPSDCPLIAVRQARSASD